MERYPAYIAGFSQPQQFEWVKEHAPALYEQIRARVAEGRLEPQGALWVEPDTNVTGGESLVRQCMYGRAFFGREFGKMPTVAHLPDCFGSVPRCRRSFRNAAWTRWSRSTELEPL